MHMEPLRSLPYFTNSMEIKRIKQKDFQFSWQTLDKTPNDLIVMCQMQAHL